MLQNNAIKFPLIKLAKKLKEITEFGKFLVNLIRFH